MKRSISFLMVPAMILTAFMHPVYAEDADGPDTLPGELGLETEEPSSDAFTQEFNSAALLNELIVSSHTAETAGNGRLSLEELFLCFDNNIDPDALDPAVKAQIDQFLDTIRPLRMPEAIYKKLRFLQSQNIAHALREAVDDPAGLLSFSHSFDLNDIVRTGLYTSLDSVDDLIGEQNQTGPDLLQYASFSEEEIRILSEARSALQVYLDGFAKANELESHVLSEADAGQLAECRNTHDPEERVQFLKDHQEPYAECPFYWAVLAESCFEKEDYQQCQRAIEMYEQKQGTFLIKDHTYARLIPLSVISLKETVNINATRVRETAPLLADLIRNTGSEDWALRYFAAQAYIEIYRISDNPYVKTEYVKNANTVIRSVVRSLVSEQKKSNAAYLTELTELKADPDASKEEKKALSDLNKLLKEDYKTALPPAAEALLPSADLMLDLTKRTQNDLEEAEAIIRPDDSALFLNEYHDRLYRKDPAEVPIPDITFDKKKLTVPASYLAQDYSLKLTIEKDGETWVFTDWKVAEVKRNESNDISSFIAELTSEENNKMKYEPDMKVTFELIPTELVPCRQLNVRFKTVLKKVFFFFNSVALEPAD